MFVESYIELEANRRASRSAILVAVQATSCLLDCEGIVCCISLNKLL